MRSIFIEVEPRTEVQLQPSARLHDFFFYALILSEFFVHGEEVICVKSELKRDDWTLAFWKDDWQDRRQYDSYSAQCGGNYENGEYIKDKTPYASLALARQAPMLRRTSPYGWPSQKPVKFALSISASVS